MHSAARDGDTAAVQSFLSEGAAVDGRDSEGCCALHWAADRGHAEVRTRIFVCQTLRTAAIM